jgi:hypothetical protein
MDSALHGNFLFRKSPLSRGVLARRVDAVCRVIFLVLRIISLFAGSGQVITIMTQFAVNDYIFAARLSRVPQIDSLMSYQSPFNFSGPGGESYSTTTPTTPLEGLDFQLPQWETVERQHQQEQQHQERQQRQLSHPHSLPPTPSTFQTIQLDEQASGPPAPPPPPPRVVPSQMHLETAGSHTHHGHGREGRSGLINTLDYSRLSMQPSDILRPISISPTAPTPTSGLVARPNRARPEAHPYKRPQSALGTKTPTMQLREGTSRRHASSSAGRAVRSTSGG